MARSMSISVSDWVFEQIRHSKPKEISRSEFIEELIRFSLQNRFSLQYKKEVNNIGREN